MDTQPADLHTREVEYTPAVVVTATELIDVAPGAEVVVRGKLQTDEGAAVPALVEVESSDRAVMPVARTLSAPVDGDVWVRLLNPTADPVQVAEGAVLAQAEPLEEQSEEPTEAGAPVAPPLPPEAARLPEHLQILLKGTERHCCGAAVDLLLEYSDVFKDPAGPLGHTSLVQHNIDTGDADPIKQAVRRSSPRQQQIVAAEVDKMLASNVVVPSDSPWSSPIVLVQKKDGTAILCGLSQVE